MEKRVIYENENGGVAIVAFAPGVEMSKENINRSVPAGKEYWIVDVSTIPTDRTFRDAWEIDKAALGPASGVSV